MPADFGGLLARAGAAPKVPALKGGAPPLEEVDDVPGTEDPLLERMLPIATDILEAVRGGNASELAEALIAAQKASAAGPSKAKSELLDLEE